MAKVKLEEVRFGYPQGTTEENADYTTKYAAEAISVVKLNGGRTIKDIIGYMSNEWGEAHIIPTQIIFEDGSMAFIGGEHDHPYFEAGDGNLPMFDEELMEDLYVQENPDEEDDEEDDDE